MNPHGVTVIIPTFNRAAKVVRAIESVLEQTHPTDAYELIVVDDGSTDDTGGIIRRRFGDRIRYIYQPNQGPSAARNRGIDEAAYELVAFLDSDDRWLPEKLQQQTRAFDISGVVLSYTNWRSSPAAADRFSEIGLRYDERLKVLDTPLATLLRDGGSGVWTSTCIARRDAVRRCGRFDERMRLCEDLRLWFRLALEGKFVAISEALVDRGEAGNDNLCRTADLLIDPEYARTSARLRLELFWEIYARAAQYPPEVAARLRHFIVTSLQEESLACAVSGDYRTARRKAVEALAFSPSLSAIAYSVVGAIVPSLVSRAYKYRRRRSKDRGGRALADASSYGVRALP